MGHEADDLLSIFDILNEDDIWQYRYPTDADLHSVGVRGIYLGNYVRWDPKAQHELMCEKYHYKGASFRRTFDTYDHVDCFNFMDLHDHIKMVKHGYSKVTDHACREIRHGRISRAEAIALVHRYQHQPLDYSSLFYDWLGIDARGMQFMLDQHKRLEPIISGCTGDEGFEVSGCDINNKNILTSLGFESHQAFDAGRKSYIVIGKGYPD